jgi:tetratricopeptide (TPR) repeat protein
MGKILAVREEQKDTMASPRLAKYRFYLRQRPALLVVLSTLAVFFFLAVTGLSHAYYRQREFLGDRWSARGYADLKANNYDAAVTDFRAALLYSRDDYFYQLNLAEALIGLSRTREASAYLLNLWDREPENGVVNLDLARIARQQGRTDQAIRYYHGAVYAAWKRGEESKRRDSRFELIDLLLQNKDQGDAEAELIALAANANDEPTLQKRIGDLFSRAGDYEHSLAAYRTALGTNQHDDAALAGAGYAAFQLQRYPLAQHYLKSATAAGATDPQSAQLLETTESVLHMDPFRPQISSTDRRKAVLDAFETAGQRLAFCPLPKSGMSGPDGSAPSLNNEWNTLKPRISAAGLSRNPDLGDKAMDLAFRIERQTSMVCGAPTGKDLALLLIAKLHEGS